MNDLQWEIFRERQEPHDNLATLPEPPPWRTSSAHAKPKLPDNPYYDLDAEKERGSPIQVRPEVRRAVNAALHLRRPLLVTGKPGTGKSSLISAVAYQLRMGPVLRWNITSRSTVKNGLYEYDAVGRLTARQAGEPDDLGLFVRLGPLGTALYPTSWPRALLIDEIDKGDIDLPNDLLNLLEEGTFEISELSRAKSEREEVKLHETTARRPVGNGWIKCEQFPFIVMTSNGEREFPAPLLRRCIRITIGEPHVDELTKIVEAHLGKLAGPDSDRIRKLIADFIDRRSKEVLATDQLLNAIFYIRKMLDPTGKPLNDPEYDQTISLILKQLTGVKATE